MSIFIMSIDEKIWLVCIFFLRRQKICWVGSLEKLKINYVWPDLSVELFHRGYTLVLSALELLKGINKYLLHL